MPPLLTVRCPAKINTFLAVGPRDERGYHPLRTEFQAVSLSDTLEFWPDDRFSITSDWADLPSNNTVEKAARLLSEISDLPSVRVHIVKRIPTESGLGGGSSDAAGFLRGVARLLPGRWADHVLHDTARAVGMDVPFFLVGGRARAEGYGERLSPLPDLPTKYLVIARPAVGVATGPAYAALDRLSYPWRDWPAGEEQYNDFERVMPCACGEAINRLLALGATKAGLSGSGLAVYGFFATQDDAERSATAWPDELGQAWSAQTLSREESLWMS